MSEFPVDIGPQYEGERIRKEDYYVEFGGPKIKNKAELVQLLPAGEVEHEKIEIVGPDLQDMKEGESYLLGIHIKVAGGELEEDTEPVLERRIHMYTNYIEGMLHMNQRDEIWLRLHKESFKKGLNTLEVLGKILIYLYTSEISLIEKISITFITDEKKVEEFAQKSREIYKVRDDRIRGLREEDVEEFYGCTLCQSFAPTHVCIVTPERVSLCGAINWLDGKAAYKLDPYGPQFKVDKGECLDQMRGIYSGANEVVTEKSLGQITEFHLHSAFEKPHTSCGCFQSILFYIPEVDGFGIVHRDFIGETPVGVPFSTMAGEASGGRQVEGYLGMAIEYMRSPKFIQADGGMKRIVWLPKAIKERVKDAIPLDLYDKIATEEDVKNVDELSAFLQEKGHPHITE